MGGHLSFFSRCRPVVCLHEIQSRLANTVTSTVSRFALDAAGRLWATSVASTYHYPGCLEVCTVALEVAMPYCSSGFLLNGLPKRWAAVVERLSHSRSRC